MSNETAEKKRDQEHGHQIVVTIDSVRKSIRQGRYSVSELKTLLGVASELELDQVVDGEFKPLQDSDDINVKDQDVFVSHVRRGGAS